MTRASDCAPPPSSPSRARSRCSRKTRRAPYMDVDTPRRERNGKDEARAAPRRPPRRPAVGVASKREAGAACGLVAVAVTTGGPRRSSVRVGGVSRRRGSPPTPLRPSTASSHAPRPPVAISFVRSPAGARGDVQSSLAAAVSVVRPPVSAMRQRRRRSLHPTPLLPPRSERPRASLACPTPTTPRRRACARGSRSACPRPTTRCAASSTPRSSQMTRHDIA